MNEKDTDKIHALFGQGIAKLEIDITEKSITSLVQYAQELIKWNRKINLVAKNTSIEDIVEKHFLDSLTLLPVLEEYVQTQGTLLDVGSGAGFPGLVIKTVCPRRPVVLLEPRQRRVSFLNYIIRTLQLKDVEVCPKRTDELLVSSSRTRYEVITGRAVADVRVFLDMVKQLVDQDSLVLCMQGASGREQWENERDNQDYLRVSTKHTCLPFSRAERSILLFRKRSRSHPR